MITGLHTIIYSNDDVATRAFFRDVLEWPHVDAGEGWLIFKTTPSELGVHPTGPNDEFGTAGAFQSSLMCDDIVATVAELRSKGVTVADDIIDEGFGLTTTFEVPGAGRMMLYQPQHPIAYELDG